MRASRTREFPRSRVGDHEEAPMAAKIDSDLRKWLDLMARTEPDKLFPFVVTVKPETHGSSLSAKGLRVDQEFPVISAVSGKMTAREALGLAADDEVTKIEYDGEMKALA
jgi:hypothetical protein